jgi:DNA polymerase
LAIPELHIDFETRSALDLRRVGAHVYATNGSTDIWCAAFAVGDGAIDLWTPGADCPEAIRRAVSERWTIHAHNANFERVIWRHILTPRYGWPEPALKQWRCSMAASLASALPGKLETVADALDLPVRKDTEGERIMRQLARLPAGNEADPEKLERLYQYCCIDVAVERELLKCLPPLIETEQAQWELNANINERGFFTDGALLEVSHNVITAAEAELQGEFHELTGLNSTNQTTKFIAWLGEHDCVVTDTQKNTLKHALRRKGLAPEVRRAIELRLKLAYASAAKVEALRAWRGSDG